MIPQIQLSSVELFSQCPASYFYSLNPPSPLTLFSPLGAIQTAFNFSYSRILETERKVEWKDIIGIVSREVYRNLDVSNDLEFTKGKQRAETCLTFLSTWYNRIYLEESIAPYVKIDITETLPLCCLTTTVPIIKVNRQGEISLVELRSGTTSLRNLYNNIRIRMTAAMVSRSLDQDIIKYDIFELGQKGGYTKQELILNKSEHKRTRESVETIISLLLKNSSYKSVSSHCDTCLFKRQCLL